MQEEQTVNIINQIKHHVANLELSAKLMYMIMHTVIIGDTPLFKLADSFFQMLIQNQLFDYNIGPPSTMLDVGDYPTVLLDEKRVWETYEDLTRAQRLHMDQAERLERYNPISTEPKELDWHAGTL